MDLNFKVVEIPEEKNLHGFGPLVEAMVANVGKALELPVGDRDSNAYRKNIRSALQQRGILRAYKYCTKISADHKIIVVWLQPLPGVENQKAAEERING